MPSPNEVKLLIYSPICLELQGGGERWLAEIAPRLTEYEITPTIVTTDFLPKHYKPKSPDWHLERFQAANLDYQRISTYRTFWSMNLPILTLRSCANLIRLMEHHDIVYFMNAYAFQDLSLMIMKRISGSNPIISGQHAALFQRGMLHNGYVSLATRAISRSFDAIHVLNRRDALQYSTWGLRNIYCIPNGVDTDIYLRSEAFNGNEFSILFVGRLDEEKGLDVLLHAIEYLEINNTNSKDSMTFRICGSGPLRTKVKRFTQKRENVDYLGFISEEELLEEYKSAHLLVMPSRHETFGLVAIEAMASGLPVIASDIPGPQDIIQENQGQLIQPGDYHDLANAILSFQSIWLNSPEKYDEMRLQIREYIVSNYDWKIVIKQLATMIRETVNQQT